MGADLNLSAFLDRENADGGRNLCGCRLLRIQPRSQGQEIPIPALAVSADLNLSAFLDGENAGCGRNLAGVGFYAFSQGVKDRRFRSQPWQKVRT